MKKFAITWKSNLHKENDLKLAKVIFRAYIGFVIFCYVYSFVAIYK